MEILQKGTTKDGVDIQIEDWSKDYPKTFGYGTTIALYPTAKRSVQGAVFEYPKKNERFRLSFDVQNNFQAKEIFEKFLSGEMDISDCKYFISSKRLLEAII